MAEQDQPVSQNDRTSPSRGKRRLLILVALLAASVYVGGAVMTDAARTRNTLVELGWLGCTLVLGLSMLNYGLRFYRWQEFLRRMGRTLPASTHFLYYLSGFAFTVSPAKAGEAFRSIHLREHGVSYSESLAALFAERLLDLVAMSLLASFIAVEHVAYRPLIVGVLVVAVVLLALARHPFLPSQLQAFASRPRFRFIAKPLTTLAGSLRSSKCLLQPRIAAFGLGVGLVSWCAEGLGFFLICQGLDLQVPATTAIGIYAIASLAGSAAFVLPAGIGGMELVMTTLLVAHGAPVRAAVIATLLCRFATLWFAVLIGVLASAIVEVQGAPKPLRSTS
jgi:uncharacterized membrane protein YbhN (UPF0104 family)